MFDAIIPCYSREKGVQALGSPSSDAATFRAASFRSDSDRINGVICLVVRVW